MSDSRFFALSARNAHFPPAPAWDQAEADPEIFYLKGFKV